MAEAGQGVGQRGSGPVETRRFLVPVENGGGEGVSSGAAAPSMMISRSP